MGETFYMVLGIETDADREAIQRAYREHVKETHPDVSDSPDAAERFKRLTTARDVLVDREERRRYDRIGHDSYVEQYAGDSAWADADAGTADRTSQSASSIRTRSRSKTGRRGTRRERRRSASTGSRSRTVGGYGTDGWQSASEAYTRTPMDVDAGRGSVSDRLLGVVRSLGPWLLVDLVLIFSAVATGWFFYGMSRHVGAPTPALISGLVFIVLVIWLALMHMLFELQR
jgi:curved DNA-binding protein CbpA